MTELSDKLLNIHNVAELLGKSQGAVAKMCQRGQLPHHKHHGAVYFSQREIENYLLNK